MRLRVFVIGFLWLAACRSAPTVAPMPVTQSSTEPAATFSLEPGDVLRVLVWREKDLGGDFRVDELGRITIPMVGTVKVASVPWYTLRDSLLGSYTRELRNPSVTLTPMRRVQVLGEVTKPGNYLADPTLSLAGVIALAGGATPGGDLRRIRVMRDGKLIRSSATVESLLLNAEVRSNDQIFVDRRAWLERNGAFLASALISTASVMIALIRR